MRQSKYWRNGWMVRFPLALLLLLGVWGCNGGAIGERGRVEELPAGEFYRTAEMNRPRYEHQAITLEDGTVLVVGGSDERLFTSIDSCEIYDQKLIVNPEPPSLSGGWLDTDFEGEDLRLQEGGRVYHTVLRTAQGNAMIVGGAEDGIMGEVHDQAENFDRATRKFVTLSSTMAEARFLHTAIGITEGELLVFGGQINVNVTIVDPNYPPNDPRFIRDINTFPSTKTIETFDSSIESEDGFGGFVFVTNEDGVQAVLSGNQGRSAHATVRIAGLDGAYGNSGDIYIQVGGIMTLSPVFAPQTKLRRMGGGGGQGTTTLLNTLDIYDSFTSSSFLAPGLSLELARAHGIMADTVGWASDMTYDGFGGLSNVFLIAGGSTDSLPTTGRWLCEGFAATFSGFGPGAGISLTRTEPTDGDQIDQVIRDVLGSLPDDPLIALVYDWGNPASQDLERNPLLEYNLVTAGIEPDLASGAVGVVGAFENFLASRMGKYFSMEAYLNDTVEAAVPINRTHTQFIRLLRRSFTPSGIQPVGTLFCGAGGYFYVVMGGQVQFYDEVPVSSAEVFDPFYNLTNAFFATPHEPYDLFTVRTYWSVKRAVPMPEPGRNGEHPNPSGSEGAWLLLDGFTPGNAFEGYEWLLPYTSNPDDYRIRFMEKGRAWHTCSKVPGADGRLGSLDDRILFAGGGDNVLAWGGQPVVPSAVLFVPPETR